MYDTSKFLRNRLTESEYYNFFKSYSSLPNVHCEDEDVSFEYNVSHVTSMDEILQLALRKDLIKCKGPWDGSGYDRNIYADVLKAASLLCKCKPTYLIVSPLTYQYLIQMDEDRITWIKRLSFLFDTDDFVLIHALLKDGIAILFVGNNDILDAVAIETK